MSVQQKSFAQPVGASSSSDVQATINGANFGTAAGAANMENVAGDVQSSEHAIAKKWIGRPLNQYVVEKWLGGGGMGQVYLGRHRWLDVPVAIKILNPMLGGDSEAIERFRRESQVAAKLNHPNIVQATDGGPIENSFFLVTEYIDGTDLTEHVQKFGRLAVDEACHVISEAARALAHAHGTGLVHRDIKPSNIMLQSDCSIKLLDLGLARYTNSQTNMTSTGQFMGTVDYVAPEQAADTRSVDSRADIYSLGCTLYYLLTGQAPFEGDGYDTIVSKILAHTDEAPRPISSFRSDVPAKVTNVLERMMAKHPDDRVQTAAEVHEALQPFAAARVKSAGASSHAIQATGAAAAQNQDDWLEEFSGRVLGMGWLVGRTVLSMVGILKRTEIQSNSRIGGGKPRYRWEISPGGLAAFVFLAACALFIYSSFEIVEVPM